MAQIRIHERKDTPLSARASWQDTSMHLADITPSIFAGLGLTSATDSLSLGQSPHGKEVLFLVDGLGADVIEKYKDLIPTLHTFVHHGDVATSFPSTTATSLATLMTGELPGTHAMLGYTVRVPRSGGRVLNSLKWDERVDPHIWQSVPTLFERAVAQNISISHVAAKRYENTGFTQAVFRGATYRGANVLEDMISETKAALTTDPSFAYVYINDLDVAGHSDGVGSDKWCAALAYVDHVAKALVTQLPRGTRVFLTADHGMVNVQEKIVLGQDNDLLDGVETIAGEPRARHLYLADSADSPTARSEFASKWREYLGKRADVFTKEEVITNQLFGPSLVENALDRMGDVIAIAHGGVILIDPERTSLEGAMVGHHGGSSDIESSVPLLSRVVN